MGTVGDVAREMWKPLIRASISQAQSTIHQNYMAMKVFVCWSGEPSRSIAEALHKWIPDVLPDVLPFMSEHNIDAGVRWGQKLTEELHNTDFGICCLTNSNLNAPWILFESGAISKSVEKGRVCTFLWGVHSADVQGPLSQFQHQSVDAGGTKKLLESLNSCLDSPRDSGRLDKAFEKWWPDLESCLSRIPESVEEARPHRDAESMMFEVLEIVRSMYRDRDTLVSAMIQQLGHDPELHRALSGDMEKVYYIGCPAIPDGFYQRLLTGTEKHMPRMMAGFKKHDLQVFGEVPKDVPDHFAAYFEYAGRLHDGLVYVFRGWTQKGIKFPGSSTPEWTQAATESIETHPGQP